MGQLDYDTFAGDLDDTSSTTLTVETRNADRVVLQVDDGTEDGTPATYDLTQRAKNSGIGRFQFYDAETGITYRSVVDPAVGQEMEMELTNQSGGTATYNAVLEARKDGDT